MVARTHPSRLTVPITIFVLLILFGRLGRLGRWGRSVSSHVTVTYICSQVYSGLAGQVSAVQKAAWVV